MAGVSVDPSWGGESDVMTVLLPSSPLSGNDVQVDVKVAKTGTSGGSEPGESAAHC
jgi:hypothetical protein